MVHLSTHPVTSLCAVFWKLAHPVLDQLNRFWPWSTFLLSWWVSQDLFYRKPVQSVFNTGSAGFWAERSKTANFGAPPIYTHSYLSLPHKSTHQTPFLTWETPPTLSHTPLASPISNLWREIFGWDWRAAIFVLHLQILLVLLGSSFGTTSSSLWIHYSWSF